MKMKIAASANYSVAALLMLMGVIYLTKSSFLSYHSDAVSLKWIEVDQNIRILILALMRGVSGGLITGSFTITFLQFKFTSNKLPWIPVLIMIIGIILSFIIIYAMLIIKMNTPGNPPIALPISGIAVLLMGYVINRSSITSGRIQPH